MLFRFVALLVGATVVSAYSQQPLFDRTGGTADSWLLANSYDTGLFTPVETLSVVRDSEWTVLSHPAFPKHSARIKKSNFCDPTVQ